MVPLFDQIKESSEIRGERELQLCELEIAVISDQGAVLLRPIWEGTCPTAVGTTLDLRDIGAIARRIGEGERDVTHG